MGAQATPETETISLNAEPEAQESTSTPEASPPPATPQTNPPADPPINPAYVRALEDTLRENNRRIQEQQDQLNNIRRTTPASAPAPTMTPEEQRNAFFNNPHEHTRNIVADEMGKQIAPLLEFIKKVPNPGNDTLKNRMKYDPRYAQHFVEEPLLEQAFDAVVAATPNVNEQSAHAIISQVIGWKVTGQLRAVLGLPTVPVTTTPTPAPSTVPNNPAPPYVPPTAPSTPRQTNTPRVRELTENERRLARERGMTAEQYIAWLDVPGESVISSKIGRNG